MADGGNLTYDEITDDNVHHIVGCSFFKPLPPAVVATLKSSVKNGTTSTMDLERERRGDVEA